MIGTGKSKMIKGIISVFLLIALVTVIVVFLMRNDNKAVKAEGYSKVEDVNTETEEELEIDGLPPEMMRSLPMSEAEQKAFYAAAMEYLKIKNPVNGDTHDEVPDSWDKNSFQPVFTGKSDWYVNDYMVVAFINYKGIPTLCHIYGAFDNGEAKIVKFLAWENSTEPGNYIEGLFGIKPNNLPMNGLVDFDYDTYNKWCVERYKEFTESNARQ